jgi:hypothetical protein
VYLGLSLIFGAIRAKFVGYCSDRNVIFIESNKAEKAKKRVYLGSAIYFIWLSKTTAYNLRLGY